MRTVHHDTSSARWQRSSHSDGSGGNCVEVADGCADIVPVRDSKRPELGTLVFPSPGWAAFVTAVKSEALTSD